jgi:hypothetical protein
MNRLAFLAPVALATAVLAAPASAGSLCLQIQDASGDGMALGLPASQNSLDIVSGDIATGRKNLVAVLRLKSTAHDPALVGGVTYTVDFTAGGAAYQLVYRVYGTGETEAELVSGAASSNSGQTVDAVVDQSTSSITWVMPRKLVPALKKPGSKLTGLGASTAVSDNMNLPTGSMRGSFSADQASTAKSYTDMTPTCVRGT